MIAALFAPLRRPALRSNLAMSLPPPPPASAGTTERPAARPATRAFGRFQLRRLLGKSERSMAWLAYDPRVEQDVMLTLPRSQPLDEAALADWRREVDLAARLKHPQVAPPSEIGVQDHWPYVAVDRAYGATLGEWLEAHPGSSALDHVGWICQLLEGLAAVHESGVAHGDLQFHGVLVSEQGQVRLMGLAAASEPELPGGPRPAGQHQRALAVHAGDLQARRERGERDVLCAGLMLYRLLAGQPALDEPDVTASAQRLPPHGRDIVRLPWSLPRPVPEALRAIVNRATSSQERQRYLNARTLLRALDGWRRVDGQDNGGPLALLLDRLRSVGHLPAMPGVGRRVARLAASEAKRTDELSREILQDMALSLEMLRQVNSSLNQAAHASGTVVITVRRAVALMGLEGVRRAAQALRSWPGPLNEHAAARLRRLMDQVRLAAFTAQALRPPGYDGEVIYLVVMLQNLGRLLVGYHFPEEAEQIRQLMRSSPPPPNAEPGTPDLPGLSEEQASLAVLGVGIDALGLAAAKHWGLGDEMQVMMRRLPLDRPVRTADSDLDVLRVLASAANEAVDALQIVEGRRLPAALAQVAQRYARTLSVDARAVKEALDAGQQALRNGLAPEGLDADGTAEEPTGSPGAAADGSPGAAPAVGEASPAPARPPLAA
ncbi:hypothetical protein ISF6_5100 [Piscinibacter sakaiensis]|uniref:Protein kinase domain-containing protein n=2 Tax=Piscinibacter sakaiensis TaxID=1547922 RepID=A0A0K8NW68_PISS1|nr:hypothetical protein ISF6_5100 [Piscinibacter sakaiensis]